MNLERQVCSLELAKKLKELGVKQESYFYWQNFIQWFDGEYAYRTKLHEEEWGVESDIDESNIPKNEAHLYKRIPAYTVAELGELLPTEQKNRLGFFSGCAINGWFCEVKNYGVMPFNRLHVELQHNTEADARAAMLIYLIENNLITV